MLRPSQSLGIGLCKGEAVFSACTTALRVTTERRATIAPGGSDMPLNGYFAPTHRHPLPPKPEARIPSAMRVRPILLCVLMAGASAVVAQPIAFTEATVGVVTMGGGHGVAVADYDRDGHEDVALGVVNGPVALFRGHGDGTFTEGAVAAGIAPPTPYHLPLWADVDGDYLPDLLLARALADLPGPTLRLYRNVGEGAFAEVPAAAGLDTTARVVTAAFGDYDADGRVDLFLAVEGGEDQLYRNVCPGLGIPAFERVHLGVGGQPGAVPMQATWQDYDRDGDLDLMAVHDGTLPTRLYQNIYDQNLHARRFSDVAFTSGVTAFPPGTCCNMGIAWGDYNRDGWPDAYVTRMFTGGLWRNNADGTFTDVAADLGVDENGMSWGVVWADFENDGDEDLAIANTSGFGINRLLLYRNDDAAFTEVAEAAGIALATESTGLAAGDFNEDGRVDLFVPAGNGQHRVLLNTTAGAGHWLKARLTGYQETNPFAIGVTIEAWAAGQRYLRTVSGGDSFASQRSPVLHIGLGTATALDSLRVSWAGKMLDLRLMADQEVNLSNFPVAIESPTEPAALVLALYPSPVRDAATLAFTLPAPQRVTLAVYDLLGRPVARLADALLPAGPHTVALDARAWPPGVYMVRLTAGPLVQTRRLLRVR